MKKTSQNQNSDLLLTDWLPTRRTDLEAHGWNELDVILFTGDAYVDHPSFGAAIIGRILEREGLRVAIVPQPNWQDDLRDFRKFGKPRLCFAVAAGNMDSMVNHYTAGKRLRSDDAYTAGGKAGSRPDRAVTVYSNILKKLFPDVPVVIGGIEASLRRLTHYDYWTDKLMPSVLADSQADLLVYGMGERAIVQIAKQLQTNHSISTLRNIPQTAFLTNSYDDLKNDGIETVHLHSFEENLKEKRKFAEDFKIVEEESNKMHARRIIQKTKNQYIVVNPPFPPATEKEMDLFYNLPFTRLPHLRYKDKGDIPAYQMIKFSVNIHHGCFGGCSFCTISAHQGKFVSSRSEKSVLEEVDKLTKMPDFKGHINDLGGPSANMYRMQGKDLKTCAKCKKPSCIFPFVCKNLNTNHEPLIELYRKVRKNERIKKATIGSGIRYDLLFDETGKMDKDKSLYLNELIRFHVSGRLKVAPEHNSEELLKIMRKPSFKYFMYLKKYFDEVNRKYELNQQLIPYFISSHPACNMHDMAELAVETKQLHFHLEQIQDFTPTPMTLSSVIYYTGIHPYTMKPHFVARNPKDKILQRKFFFWYEKENRKELMDALRKIGRIELISKLFGKL